MPRRLVRPGPAHAHGPVRARAQICALAGMALLLALPALADQGRADAGRADQGPTGNTTTLQTCRALTQDRARLACYDALPAGAVTPSPATGFAGAGNTITPPFQVAGNQWLVFESSDAVMVVYLLDNTGQVVQNLHRGGAGRGSYQITQAGRYRVQINATGGWRVWIED